jgi:hydroxyacylglutathione hydrolase
VIVSSVSLGPLAANAYVLADREGGSALIVDPGDPDISALVEMVDSLDVKVVGLALTHGHFDHAGGLAEAKRTWPVSIHAHPGDAPFLDRLVDSASVWGVAVDPAPEFEPVLSDGDKIEIGALALYVMHTPGHSRGGVCFVGDGKAVVGDLIFEGGVGRTDLPGGSLKELVESITNRIFPLGDDCVLYPGHGNPTTVGKERIDNPFVGCEGALLEGIDEGRNRSNSR